MRKPNFPQKQNDRIKVKPAIQPKAYAFDPKEDTIFIEVANGNIK